MAAKRCLVAVMPYAAMSRVIAVRGGWTTWLMSESSHPTIETSSGTEKPICCATPRPVTASRSLSNTIARRRRARREKLARRSSPDLGAVVRLHDLDVQPELRRRVPEAGDPLGRVDEVPDARDVCDPAVAECREVLDGLRDDRSLIVPNRRQGAVFQRAADDDGR